MVAKRRHAYVSKVRSAVCAKCNMPYSNTIHVPKPKGYKAPPGKPVGFPKR